MGNSASSKQSAEGEAASTLPPAAAAIAVTAAAQPVESTSPTSAPARNPLAGGKCPVDHSKFSTAERPSACPVAHDASPGAKYKHPHVYNVYAERIDSEKSSSSSVPPAAEPPSSRNTTAQGWSWRNALKLPSFVYMGIERSAGGEVEKKDGDGEPVMNPLNNMPLEANQRPAPGQRVPLSTEREKSSIPKGGTEDKWVYPSPQMFYNALVRKEKADGVTEEDMDVVVMTHNMMNEATWARAMLWERFYEKLYPEAAQYEPTLLYFKGRPHDISPRARLAMLFGHEAPFDRHDWVIDRGGREMRYVIDFYFDEEKAGSPDAFEIDIRPALDSPEAAFVRLRYSVDEVKRALGLGGSPAPMPAAQSAMNES
nr:TPA_exp: holocytochrome c synthase [Spirotaenia minuta]